MLFGALIPSGNGSSRQSSSPAVFGSLHREIDRLLDDFTRGGLLGNVAQNNIIPSIDVVETEDAVEVTAELPGLERKDVEISVEDDVLTIRGEKRIEARDEGDGQSQSAGQPGQQGEQGQQGQQGQGQKSQGKGQAQPNSSRNYVVSERSYGVFLRGLQLPPGVDQSKIEATMSNGVLKIRIPKPKKAEPKKIEVKEAA
jgi:HSP20 family protein